MATSYPPQATDSGWNTAPTMARADDPLDAIDALEDAIEEVGQSLPPLMEENGLESPTKTSNVSHGESLNGEGRVQVVNGHSVNQDSPGKVNTSPKRPSGLHSNDGQQGNSPRKLESHNTGRPRAETPRASFSSTGSASVSRQVGSRKSSHSSTPPMKTPNGRISQGSRGSESPAKLSVQKPGFVPQKSSKEPTRPTFELPGEAISRRKREKLEEKRRQEEEEQKKKREFKAKGVGYSRSSEVRETATSRARANRSSLVLEPRTATPVKRQSGTPTPARASSTRTVSIDREARDAQSPAVSRTQSVRRNGQSRLSAASPEVRTRKPDTATSTPVAKQDPIAKGKSWTQEKRQREQERQEKEEAVRRARAEAAERSRQAGRAWAEKQRLKIQPTKPSDSK